MKDHPPDRRWLALSLALLAPAVARGATLTLEEPLLGRAECLAADDTEVELSWELGTATGSELQLLASDASGCAEDDDDVTTAVLVDGISTSQTAYPLSGDDDLSLAEVLDAAGKATDCTGSTVRVYLCVRLLDGAGDAVTTASATLKLELTSPPPPASLAVAPGEGALYVSWDEGDTTTAAPADSATYLAFAAAGGVTRSSGETSSTSARIGGLENGTTYDVWVVAYSEAGNASEPSELTAGTPVPVSSFWEAYQESGGREQGGCGQGSGAALWALAAVVALFARRRRAAAGLLVAALAGPALADEPPPDAAPRGSVSFRIEGYRLAIDDEFSGAANPAALSLGGERGLLYRLDVARDLAYGPLVLELGAGAGWHRASGRGLYRDTSGAWARSGDATALTLVPLSVFGGARLTALRRLGVPLEPYARLSLERYLWWATGTSQETVSGATDGYAVTFGLALRLDDLDPGRARELAAETGVRGTTLTFDLSRAVIDDFGSSRSWDLSDPGWAFSGGLRLAF